MTPDLPLAKHIAEAVMTQIETDRCVNRENIVKVVYAHLLFANAVATAAFPEPWPCPPNVVSCASALIAELKHWIIANAGKGVPARVSDAGSNLEQAMLREGLL